MFHYVYENEVKFRMALNLLAFYHKPDVGRVDYLKTSISLGSGSSSVEILHQTKFMYEGVRQFLLTTCTTVPDNDPYWHSLETQAWHECGSMIVTIVPLAGSFASELGGPN